MRFVQLLIAVAVVSYLSGFLVLAFLRRWRELLLVGSAAVLFSAWAFVAARRLESYDGLFAIVALTFLTCGLVAGFLFRAGVLKLHRLREEGLQAAFGTAIFVLVPALFCGTAYGLHRIGETLRAPTLACASGLHQATLGDMRLALPTAPNLVIKTKRTSLPDYYWFNNPEDISRFCNLAATSRPALASVKLQTDVVSLDRSTWFCAERRDYDWWQTACRPDNARTEPRFSGEIEVFLIDQSRNIHHARLWEELQRIQAGERPLISAADGFRRYRKDDRFFSYIRDDDTGYVAECEGGKNTKSAYMVCSVARELAPNIGLTYRFGVTDDNSAKHARALDVKATAFVTGLQAP